MIRPPFDEGVDEGVDERLIVEPDFAARRIAGVVALEGTETVDEPIGLRAVVVREDREILAQHVGVIAGADRRRRSSSDPRCA